MAEERYEWDCESLLKKKRQLEEERDNLKKHIDAFSRIKENMKMDWHGEAGEIAQKRIATDSEVLSQIVAGLNELSEILYIAAAKKYPSCNESIHNAYIAMLNAHQ